MKPVITLIITMCLLASLFIVLPTPKTTVQAASSGTDAPVKFVNVSEEVGLQGVRGDNYCWGDYNKDGYEDLLVKGSRLFKNNGPPDWDFTEVSAQAGLSIPGYSSWGDYDNDGWLDFYSVNEINNSQDHLWHNNQDGTFTDVTLQAGNMSDPYPSLACGWGDYDQDSYLDAYVINWRDANNVCYPDTLWHNNGDGTFTDVTIPAGVKEGDPPYAGMGFTWGEYNNDGWPDIYVGNYLLMPNYMYENNQDGTFTDVAPEKGTNGHGTWTPQGTYYGHSPGSAFADLDNDLDMDLWVSNLAHRDYARALICDSSYFFRNDGPSTDYGFTDIFDQCGVPSQPAGGNEELYFGVSFSDWDNDGDLDMYIPQVKSYIDYAYSYMFRNDGDMTFTDTSDECGLRVWDTVGAAFCDYDQDGDMDVVMDGNYPYTNGTYTTRLFQNQGNDNNWVGFKLKGTLCNRAAIGARVTISLSDGRNMMRDVESEMGNHCYQNTMTQHFGLGTYFGTVDATIRWSPWNTQVIRGLEINKVHEITEAEPNTDLEVSDVAFPKDVDEGQNAQFQVSVKNVGDAPAKGYSVTLRLNGFSGTVLSNSSIATPLASGAVSKQTLTWNTEGYSGAQTVYACIEQVEPMDTLSTNDYKACDLTINPIISNRPPVISSFEASNNAPTTGEAVILTVDAQDPDGDALSYSFDCMDGILSPSGNTATWTAPMAPGSYPISVEVSDGHGHSVGRSLELSVNEPFNEPPVITSFTYEPADPTNSGSDTVLLKVNVMDGQGIEDLDRAVFRLQNIGETQDIVITDAQDGETDGIFTLEVAVPKDLPAGDKAVSVEVYDKKEAKATADTTITVKNAKAGGGGDDDDDDDNGSDLIPGGMWTFYIIAAIIGLFVIIIVFLTVVRRR